MRWLLLLALVGCAAGDDEETGDGRPDSPEPFTIMQGDPEQCAPDTTLKPPSDDFVGSWVAARLTPPWTPARVESVKLAFDGRIPCTIAQAGAAQISVGGPEPDATPTIVASYDLEAADNNTPGGTVVTLDIQAGAMVEEGQFLYVITRASGTPGSTRCPRLCQDVDKSDEIWWADGVDAPLTWTRASDLGIIGQMAVSASGQAPMD